MRVHMKKKKGQIVTNDGGHLRYSITRQ